MQTVLTVVVPLTGDGDPFTGADLCGMTHHGDQLAMTAGLDAQHAEPVGGVVEGDALHRSGEHFIDDLGGGAGVVRPGHTPSSDGSIVIAGRHRRYRPSRQKAVHPDDGRAYRES